MVCSISDFFLDVGFLPFEPITDFGELRFSVNARQSAIFVQAVLSATLITGESVSLGRHMEFLAAVGALIKDPLKAFRSIRIIDFDAVLQLIFFFVGIEAIPDRFLADVLTLMPSIIAGRMFLATSTMASTAFALTMFNWGADIYFDWG